MTVAAPTPAAPPTEIVNTIAVSPQLASDGVAFAARSSGLYRSADGGRSWRPAYASLSLSEPLTTTAVALSPAFAADGLVLAGANGGVLRSADRGATWERATMPAPPPLVTALALSPAFAADGVAFAATLEDGVLRSEDRGRSWHGWNFGLLDQSALCLALSPDFADDRTLLAGTGSGLFQSLNGGRSWRELPLPADCPAVLSVAFTADAILVGTEEHGAFRSEDGGDTWRPLGAELPAGAVNAIVTADSLTAPDLLLLVDDTLVASIDGGATWAERGPAGISAVAAAGTTLLLGLAGGEVMQL
jgi:photosystem II stability/assembly factor-like uncharacterized protein